MEQLNKFLVLFTLTVGWGCGDSSRQSTLQQWQTDQSPLPMKRLHVKNGENSGIFDEDGRKVILRGVNYNALADYYQDSEKYPPVVPMQDDDFRQMASYGFNVIRLVINWSLLEPRPNQISETYIAQIREVVSRAKAEQIYVILDMHQDAWGKSIYSKPDDSCPPDINFPIELPIVGRRLFDWRPSLGWDGAPDWATKTNGLSNCIALGIRELSPAVASAFQNFYLNTDGIQDHILRVWRRLAQEFADEPAVVGYDLLNEPNPGFIFNQHGFDKLIEISSFLVDAISKGDAYGIKRAFLQASTALTNLSQLSDFYQKAVEYIREGEQESKEGFPHIILFEPTATWSALGATVVPPPFSDDPNLVFAPHLYAESVAITNISIEQGFEVAIYKAKNLYDRPLFVGEWGFFGEPRDNVDKILRYTRIEDHYQIGGTWWSWSQGCGDPHEIKSPGGTPGRLILHFNITSCEEGSINQILGVVPEYANILSRPYPRAAPGIYKILENEIDKESFEMEGVSEEKSVVDLWVPRRNLNEPKIEGQFENGVRIQSQSGGFRLFVPVSGYYRIRVFYGEASEY